MSIVKKAPNNRANVFISGEIYTGMAKQLKQELSELGDVDKLFVYLDSPGGNYNEGIAVYMTLSIHPAYKNVYIQGFAGSMALAIAMAGDTTTIAVNSWIMMHEVTGGGRAGDAQGNKRLIEIYQNATGLSKPDLADMLACETWLDSGQAVAGGFADSIGPPVHYENEDSYLKHRTAQNHFTARYESFAQAQAKRKTKTLKTEMSYMRNKAAILRDQRELCSQYNITTQEFNLLMNQ